MQKTPRPKQRGNGVAGKRFDRAARWEDWQKMKGNQEGNVKYVADGNGQMKCGHRCPGSNKKRR